MADKAAMRANSSATESSLAWAAAASVFLSHAKHKVKRYLRQRAAPSPGTAEAVRALRREGYFIIPGYYTSDQCAFLRGEIDRIIREQPDSIQKDPHGSDFRIFGSENASAALRDYHQDTRLTEIGEAYWRGPLQNFSTLAARLTAMPGNNGSGQGWHRDAFHFQFKSMIYLSDVTLKNGPFQIMPGSHRSFDVLRDTLHGRLDPPPASRITEAQVGRLLANEPARAKALPAAAGTLILFDSSTIHRGMPIQTGTRYALTNYYYQPEAITEALYRHFTPMAHA